MLDRVNDVKRRVEGEVIHLQDYLFLHSEDDSKTVSGYENIYMGGDSNEHKAERGN